MWAHPGLLLGSIIVSVYTVISLAVFVSGLFGARITPYDPIELLVGPALSPPSWSHLFGTDTLGRDLFSEVISAMPTDMGVSVAVVVVAVAAGLFIGSFAAYSGGLFDEALMRVTDVFFALPVLVLAIVMAVILGPGIRNMMIVLMIVWWPTYARLARGETLKIVNQSFIEAARMSGIGTFRIIFRHVYHNVIFILLVYATLDVGTLVLVYAGLSYLGLAVTPPHVDWGQMVDLYQDDLISSPWLPLFPSLMIVISVIGFSLLGDSLRDVLEVK
jgi:ABC-type dipeptide/oligopeptide/nickel transport system permease subunit